MSVEWSLLAKALKRLWKSVSGKDDHCMESKVCFDTECLLQYDLEIDERAEFVHKISDDSCFFFTART